MVAVHAFTRRAAACPASRLLHGCRDVLEVRAAGALQQVAAGGGQVAELPRGAGEQRLGEHREALAHPRIGGEVAVGHGGADPQAAVRESARPRSRCSSPTSTSSVGRGDAELHQVDEVRAAAEERAVRLGRRAAATASAASAGALVARTASSPHALARPTAATAGRCWRRPRSGRGCRSSARGSPRRRARRRRLRSSVTRARPAGAAPRRASRRPSRPGRACSSRTGRRRARRTPAASGAARRRSASPST